MPFNLKLQRAFCSEFLDQTLAYVPSYAIYTVRIKRETKPIQSWQFSEWLATRAFACLDFDFKSRS